MSDPIEKCVVVKEKHSYGPPCFIGPDDRPQCDYETEEQECGLNLEGLQKGLQLADLFQTARGTLSPYVLSRTDALKKALVNYFEKPCLRENPNRKVCMDWRGRGFCLP